MKHILRRSLSLFLILALSIGILPVFASAAEDMPEVDARAAVMMDADSGNVLYSLNEDTPLYVAGLTVMMTALLAAEAVERGEIAYSDVVTASSASHNDITADASIQNIVPGEEMSLENLLYCALIGGASEACNIIGEYVAGSLSSFISQMNARAKELGCRGTNFVNAHGLPNNDHFSTAYDMALIAAEFVQHEALVDIANTVSREIPATNVSGVRKLTNGNYILRTDYTRYYYSYACGIKSTYTEDAGYCLASSMKTDGNYVVSIVLGCRVQEADNGFYDIQSFVQTKRLFQWFNNNYSLRDVVSIIEPVVEVPVALGEGTDTVVLCASEELKLFLPNDLVLNDHFRRNITIYSDAEGAEPLTAPITQGQLLGEMTVVADDGTVFGPFKLVANTDVAVSRVEMVHRRISDLLHGKWFKIIFLIVIIILLAYLAFVIRYRVLRHRERAARRAERREAEKNRR